MKPVAATAVVSALGASMSNAYTAWAAVALVTVVCVFVFALIVFATKTKSEPEDSPASDGDNAADANLAASGDDRSPV